MKNYVSLHTHTTFSLLDGISKRDELIKLTKEYGMPGLALTEHGNLFNCISFYRDAVKAGIVPIIGYEAYVAPDSRLNRSYAKKGDAEEDAKNGDLSYYAYHLTVLAKNRAGYESLKSLSTLAYKEGFYRKPRIDDELLERHKDGLIVLSGCLAGKIARYIIAGNKPAAIMEIDKLRFIHGENFYLELMAHNIDEERIVREVLIDVSKTHGIPTVMTGDSHFTHHGDETAHTVALNMGIGKTLADEDKWAFPGDGYWYKKPQEMYEIAQGASIPEEALSNTVNICKSIEDYDFKLASKTKKFVVPLFREEDHVYTDEECNQLLEFKAWQGLADRGVSDSEVHRARLIEELAMMKSKNFSSYFLIISDIVDFMRANNIIVPIGRGSSLGSLVCYSLFVTGLDPVEHTIPFERFINEGRKDLPDVDTDISQENRGKVLQYIAKKYGADRVAHIVTFQSLRPKAALDNVGRVLDVPHSIRKQATADIHDDPTSSDTLVELVASTPTTKKIIDQIPNWYEIAVKLEGNNRNLGSHAAGIVISNSSLSDAGVPLMRDSEDGLSTTQLDMDDMAELGLLKLDMLGLKTMDVIAKTLEQIKSRYDTAIDWHHIPLDDAGTYNTIYSGKFVSVFQYDSSGMRNLARQLRPENFDHLVAINCLYRPGPMKRPEGGGQSILEMYLDRRHGRANIENWHPELEQTFRPTLGLLLFQEQLMGLAQVISGFNKVEADEYRAAVGKKDREKFLAAQTKLVNRGIAIGRDPKFMTELADKVAGFARYGWNKGHACLRTGTKVLTCDRGLVEIQDIKPGDELWSIRHDTGDLFRNRVVNLFNNGIKRIVRIKAGGSTLECTGDHRLLSSEKLYKDANQFLPGDRLQMLDERINRANLNIGVTSLTDRDQIPLWVSSDDLERYNVMDLQRARSVAYRTNASISGNDFVGNRKLDFLPVRPTDGFVPPTIFKDRSRANVDSTLGKSPSNGQLTSDPVSGDDLFNHLSYFRGNCIGPVAANSPFLETTGQTGASSFKRESCHNLLGSIAFEPQTNNKIFVDLERVNLNKAPVTGSASSPLSDSYGKSAYFTRDLLSIVTNKTSATVGFDDIGIRTELGTTSNTNIIDHTKIIHDWNVDSNVDTGEDDVVWDLEMEQDPNFIANGFVVHNCAYSYISYVTAWLETHYPHEYYTSLLNTADDDAKKLAILISAILQRGVKLLPPDINKSNAEFTTDGKAIYMGLYSIKQVGEGAAKDILADRDQSGPYKDFIDFNVRLIKSRLTNRTVKDNLIKSGAFNWDTSITTKDKLSNVEKIQTGFKKYLDKLGMTGTLQKISEKTLITGEEYSKAQLLELEKAALNFYISSHPALHFCKTFRLFPNANFILPNQLQDTTQGDTVLICGLITGKDVKPTQNGSMYLAMTISDNAVDIKVRVWSPLGPQIAQNIAVGQMAIVVGTAVPDNFVPTEMSIKVKKVIPIQTGTGMPINAIWAENEADIYAAANILGGEIGAIQPQRNYIVGHFKTKGYIKPEVVDILPTYKVGYSLDI